MNYHHQTLSGRQVLDGNEYKSVLFENAQMVIEGRAAFVLHSCRFKNCSWSFKDPAAIGIVILTKLYEDPALRPLVDAMINNIKAGRIGPVALH